MSGEFTILNVYDASVFRLDVLNKKTIVQCTDLAILLGGEVFEGTHTCKDLTSNTSDLIDHNKPGKVILLNNLNNRLDGNDPSKRNLCVRPVIRKLSNYDLLLSKSVDDEVQYGYYPQTALDNKENERIEKIYNTCLVIPYTNNKYTICGSDGVYTDYREIEFYDQRYIRFESPNGYSRWVKVEPVMWVIDRKYKRLIAKKSLLSGLNMASKNDNYHGNVKKTQVYRFMNKYLINDLFQNYKINNLTYMEMHQMITELAKKDDYYKDEHKGGKIKSFKRIFKKCN